MTTMRLVGQWNTSLDDEQRRQLAGQLSFRPNITRVCHNPTAGTLEVEGDMQAILAVKVAVLRYLADYDYVTADGRNLTALSVRP